MSIVKPALAQITQDWITPPPGQQVVCVTETDVATIQGLGCLFYNVLQVITYLAGLVFLFMFIKGGFTYLFSGADPKKTAAASATLTMSVIGLVGIIVSWFVLRFIQEFTGINVIDFVIPS